MKWRTEPRWEDRLTNQDSEVDDQPLVDWGFALRTVRGSRTLLRAVVEAFVEEGPVTLRAIRQAIEDQLPQQLQRECHKLKGAARYLGGEAVARRAQELEELGSHGVDLSTADPLFEDLETTVARMTALLLDYLQSSPA